MSEDQEQPPVAVHVCKSCGAVCERSAVNTDNTITGLIKCPSCGFQGDLNLEIRSANPKRPPRKTTS